MISNRKLNKLALKERKGTVKTMINNSNYRIQWTISKTLKNFIEETKALYFKDMTDKQYREYLLRLGLEKIWKKKGNEKDGKAEN